MFLNEVSEFPRSMKDFTVGSKWTILRQRSGNCDHLKAGYTIEIHSTGSSSITFKVLEEEEGGTWYFRNSFKDGWLRRGDEYRADHYQDIKLRRA